MKKISILIIIAIAFLWSCEDMYEKQKEFMGEVVYPAKFDTIIGYVGFERVEIELMKAGRIPSGEIRLGKAKKTVVEYDDQVITIDSLVSYVSIENLTQSKLYRFSIYTIDEYGNKSVPLEIALIPFTTEDVRLLEVPAPKIQVKKESETQYTGYVSWLNFSSVLLDYKSLSYKYTNKGGGLVEGTAEVPSLTIDDIALDAPFTIYAEYEIIPKINGDPILDSAPMWDTISFLPADYYTQPIYMLATSSGWDESSFIQIEAIDKGIYKAEDVDLINGDKIRFFKEPKLDAEVQYGFALFNSGTLSPVFSDTDDGNDNLVFNEVDGLYDLTIYTDAKLIQGMGAYGGIPWEIPGRIEAEDYNVGGQGVGYYDTEAGNSGNSYREENVDIGGGPADNFNIGWTAHGEWLKYTVNVTEAGDYHLDISMSSPNDNVGKLILEYEDEELFSFQGIKTGDWGSYSTFPVGDIYLTEGKKVFTIRMENPGLNFDAMIFTKL